MKRYIVSAIVLFSAIITNAQPEPPVSRGGSKDLKDNDEIVIKRKDTAKDGKVTIEIRDEQVFVDGKPIEDYNGNDFIIRKRRPNAYTMIGPPSPFRQEGNWFSDDNGDMAFDAEDGKDHAFLGVLTDKSADGAKIVEVTENSAASKAGLKTGDVITKINDQSISDQQQLSKVISSLKPEEKVTITYKRDNKEAKTNATLGKRSVRIKRMVIPHAPMPGMDNGAFDFDNNIDVFNLHKTRLGIKAQDTEDGKGAKVLDVQEDSPAQKAGIEENDIITSFEGKEVSDAMELARMSAEAHDKTSVKLQLKRNGKSQTVEVKIPRKLKTANL